MKTKYWLILVFLMLLYHYNVYFPFLFTHTRKYFFVWGVFLLLSHRRNLVIDIPKKARSSFICSTAVIIIMTIISTFRGELELMAIQIPISFIVNMFAAYPIVYLIYKWSNDVNGKIILNYAITILIFAIVVNNMIAISKLFMPSFYDILMRLQVQDESVSESITIIDAYRLGGWGENLIFSGGPSSALCILLSMYKYCKTSVPYEKVLYAIIMVFVLFSGILIARTTLIGIPLAGLVLVHYIVNVKSFIKTIFIAIILVIITVILFIYITPMLDDKMSKWAFELIFNFMDEGEVSGESANELKGMWDILPTNIDTWLLGDGYFKSSTGNYYKGTDVGVMRIIFFIGLIGLFAIFKLFMVFFLTKKADKDTQALLKVLFIWFVVMNLKGVFLPIHVACLFSIINNLKIKKLYEQT